ncbi:ribonuclease H-like domain-containing protein [Tanacetum coccineum]
MQLVLLGEKGKLLLSPQQVVIGDHKDTMVDPNTMVDPVLENDYPHRALKNKGIVDSGCSRHMTANKAYLAEFQCSKGYITGKGKIKTGRLACLIAKVTTDESNKWHRRLGHVNFKNLNKLVKGNLVKGNLVRGLPSKLFQNDHTCVACQKGKQHKASWDSDKENESAQDCFVLPIWPSYSSTITPALKSADKREGPREEEQVFVDELETLVS